MAKDIKTNIVIGGKVAKSLQKAFGESEKGIQQLERAYQQASAVGVKAFKAVGMAVVASVTALTAAAESTREFRQDLNKMYTNAEKAKLSLGETDKALSNLYSVSGEFDSANEALSNLIATGYKGKDLEAVINAVNGASIKWQDTIKSESLADAIQESLASGTLTGQFSEIMSRSGADVEAFQEKLASASTLAERQQLVLNWLAKSGLAEVNASYRENNKQLVAAYESDLKYQKSLAKVGEAAEPLATLLKGGLSGAFDLIAKKLQGVDFEKVAVAMDKVGAMGSKAFEVVWETLSKIDWDTVINSAVTILDIFTKIFNFVVGNWSSISPLIYGIVAAMVAYKAITVGVNTVTAIANGLKVASATLSAIKAGATLSEAAAMAVATGAQLGLNLAFLACPITWIVLGIGAIIAVIAAIANKVGGFKNLWEICWKAITTAFDVAVEGIKAGIDWVTDAIKSLIKWFEGIGDWFSNLFGGGKKSIDVSVTGKGAEAAKNAIGSTVTKPTLTWVGEGGDTETIVPHNDKPRSQALALEAVKGTGLAVGGNTFVFSPTIYAGGMSETTLRGILNDAIEDFKAQMNEYTQNAERLAY